MQHEDKPRNEAKGSTYKVVLDALALTTCYPTFLITAEVLVIYMHQFWATVIKHKSSYQFKIDKKKFYVNVKVFREILNICPKVPGKAFDEPPTKEEALSFIRELGHTGEIKYITYVIEDLAYQINNIDSKKKDKMFYLRFMKIIIYHFLEKDKSISMRNRMFMHTTRDDSLLGTMRFVSRHADTQVYGAIHPQAMTNQALLDSISYKTYYAIASGAEPPMSRKIQKKSDSAISSEESPSKKKSVKVKKVATAKPKPTKKKALIKADKGKGLNVLSDVALSEAAQLKEATKRSKKDFHISQESGSGDGTDFESGVPDEQHLKTTGADEGIGTIPGVPDIPKYDFESEKESWGDSGEEDEDDENYSKDKSDDGDDDDDANDDDNQEGDDMNDDEEEIDSDRTESDIIQTPVLNQSSTEYYEEEKIKEEENIDDEKTMDDEEDGKVTKEMYKDAKVNLGNKDTEMTDADQGSSEQQNVSQESWFEQVEKDAHVTLTPVLDTQKADEPLQSSSVSSDFTSKLLNLENSSPADNEIASLMETSARHAMTVPEITSGFTTTIPPPPLFFNPLPQQETPTPTPTTSEATTSFPSLLDFSFIFKFNDRVTNFEKDVSEIKQVDQYAQALSSIPAIVDRYIDNKLGKVINKAIQAHNLDCRKEAQDEKNDVYDFATPMIEKNIAESLEAVVLKRSSSQLQSTYEVATALFEIELTKMLIDKMEKNKSYDKAAYKRELYEALVKSYKTDLFDLYGEVFTLKRSRDDRDKDQYPSTRSDRRTKRRKSSKELTYLEIQEEPSHTVKDSGVQKHQDFITEDNNEQPTDKEVTKVDWIKKPERPPTPDTDWNKRQQVDF
ncbi:hypothetical protein Tco_0169668 [Tanacetum coccineum]